MLKLQMLKCDVGSDHKKEMESPMAQVETRFQCIEALDKFCLEKLAIHFAGFMTCRHQKLIAWIWHAL